MPRAYENCPNMLLPRLWAAKRVTMPFFKPSILSLSLFLWRESRLSLKIQTMGLKMPRPKGIEFSWERKRKKFRGSIKILSSKQQRKKRFCLTWKGRKAVFPLSISRTPKGCCWSEAPAGPLWGGRKTLWCYSTAPPDQSPGKLVQVP